MVKKREIKIVIGKDGKVQIEPLNAEGKECLKWTKEIEESLGSEVNRELKDEFYLEIENETESIDLG